MFVADRLAEDADGPDWNPVELKGWIRRSPSVSLLL
jgi:hypothetical protein